MKNERSDKLDSFVNADIQYKILVGKMPKYLTKLQIYIKIEPFAYRPVPIPLIFVASSKC